MEYKYNKKGSKKNAATNDQHVVQLVGKLIKKQQEHKSFDTGFGSSVSNAGTLQKLSTIPQGDTDSTRDGDALMIYKIDIDYSFAFADPINAGRLLVFRWNQDDTSAAPTVADLLQTLSPYSPYNRDNLRARKFSIIHDSLDLVGATGPNIVGKKLTLPFNSKISFQTGANTGNGHIYAFMVSDSAAIAHPVYSYVARVWFTDS